MGGTGAVFSSFQPLPGSIDIFAGENVTRVGWMMRTMRRTTRAIPAIANLTKSLVRIVQVVG